jgi:hypothetical protein
MKDRNGKRICVRDFLLDENGIYQVLDIGYNGVTVEEVEIVDDVICSVISIGAPWVKTKEEVAKCVVW